MPQRHYPRAYRLLRVHRDQTQRVVRQMHRHVQSDDQSGDRAKIGNRQSSHQCAGSTALHYTTQLLPNFRGAVTIGTLQKHCQLANSEGFRERALSQSLTPDRMFQKMKNVSVTKPVSLNIDSHPALQDELARTEKGTNVVFLHTTVDDGDHFQQILAWTLKSSIHAPAEITFRSLARRLSSTLPDQAEFSAPPYFPPSALARTCPESAALVGIDAAAMPALADKCLCRDPSRFFRERCCSFLSSLRPVPTA